MLLVHTLSTGNWKCFAYSNHSWHRHWKADRNPIVGTLLFRILQKAGFNSKMPTYTARPTASASSAGSKGQLSSTNKMSKKQTNSNNKGKEQAAIENNEENVPVEKLKYFFCFFPKNGRRVRRAQRRAAELLKAKAEAAEQKKMDDLKAEEDAAAEAKAADAKRQKEQEEAEAEAAALYELQGGDAGAAARAQAEAEAEKHQLKVDNDAVLSNLHTNHLNGVVRVQRIIRGFVGRVRAAAARRRAMDSAKEYWLERVRVLEERRLAKLRALQAREMVCTMYPILVLCSKSYVYSSILY